MKPFVAVPANIEFDQKNVVLNEWQRKSETFDFTREDAVPDKELNLVLWHSIKGDNVPMPEPRRAAFLKVREIKNSDD
jgi:hypothetical protein